MPECRHQIRLPREKDGRGSVSLATEMRLVEPANLVVALSPARTQSDCEMVLIQANGPSLVYQLAYAGHENKLLQTPRLVSVALPACQCELYPVFFFFFSFFGMARHETKPKRAQRKQRAMGTR